MIDPLKWLSIVIRCGFRKLLNIIAHVFDICVIRKVICQFTIDFRSYYITTQILALGLVSQSASTITENCARRTDFYRYSSPTSTNGYGINKARGVGRGGSRGA